MTDKNIDEKLLESLNQEDEKLLASFFSEMAMPDIPDAGFSHQVMKQIPMGTPSVWLERLWTAICVIVGLAAVVAFQFFDQLQSLLFSMKIDFLLSSSRALTSVSDVICHAQNLWMALGACVVLFLVWGYNELMDLKESI